MKRFKELLWIVGLVLSGVLIRSWFIDTHLEEGAIITWKDYVSVASVEFVIAISIIIIKIILVIKSTNRR